MVSYVTPRISNTHTNFARTISFNKKCRVITRSITQERPTMLTVDHIPPENSPMYQKFTPVWHDTVHFQNALITA